MERWLVRIVSTATFVAGAVVAARATTPRPLPGWALSSRFVFGLTVALAIIGPTCFLLTLAVQTIVRGRVPTAISREGLTWTEELASSGEAAIAQLQDDVVGITANLDELATRVMADRSPPA
ncbi:MAG TPA: hypothetical protein VF101_19625 [Gaiellaceae bacterium]